METILRWFDCNSFGISGDVALEWHHHWSVPCRRNSTFEFLGSIGFDYESQAILFKSTSSSSKK